MMSSQPPSHEPGASDPHAGRRTAFRVLGVALTVLGVGCLLVALMDLFGAVSSDDLDASPTKFWLAFVGIPLIAVGGWLLQAGFGGAMASYAAAEAAPALRTAGEALGTRPEAASSSCPRCGHRTGVGARFCEGCGTPLGSA